MLVCNDKHREVSVRWPPSDDMDEQKQRGRVNSTCSEEGTEATQEADYDGDGEDSIHYSSTENLHHVVRKNKGGEGEVIRCSSTKLCSL